VQPKAPLLQILRVAGAQEEVFTLKEVMNYLGQYIMGRQLYDKQRQHIVHCQDDPLGELLEVDSFCVKNPSPVYEMLKKYLVVLGSSDCSRTVSDPVILPSHSTVDRPLPTMVLGKGKGPLPSGFHKDELLSGGESQENLGMEVEE
ncbi:unnamed protein product, partial [Pleuronectes platessa]